MGVELVFKKLPISRIWGYPVPNSRVTGHQKTDLPHLVEEEILLTGERWRVQVEVPERVAHPRASSQRFP